MTEQPKDPLLEAGRRVRRQVLGAEHVAQAEQRVSPLDEPFQDYITRSVWAQIWARPGLGETTRRYLTIAVLTALRAEAELELHLRAARRAGIGEAEIGEVILHTAPYAGVPAANAAITLAKRILAETDESLGTD